MATTSSRLAARAVLAVAGIALASMVSFPAGRTRANNAQILLSTDGTGRVAIQNSSGGTLDLSIDVTGYYE